MIQLLFEVAFGLIVDSIPFWGRDSHHRYNQYLAGVPLGEPAMTLDQWKEARRAERRAREPFS
jgi:hypothetical protein